MFIEILACVALYSGYRAFKKQPRQCSAPIPHSKQSGDEGEARVDAELRRVLTWLCGENFYVHPGAVLLHHAPGTEFPTAEIDHLAITPFGIFVIETKHWSGRIAASETVSTLLVEGSGGRQETRRSPIAQNRAKVGFLRGTLPGMWPVYSLGVFSHGRCDLSPGLPLDLVAISDLALHLRSEKARFERKGLPQVRVQQAWNAIQRLCVHDQDGSALAAHRFRVTQMKRSNARP